MTLFSEDSEQRETERRMTSMPKPPARSFAVAKSHSRVLGEDERCEWINKVVDSDELGYDEKIVALAMSLHVPVETGTGPIDEELIAETVDFLHEVKSRSDLGSVAGMRFYVDGIARLRAKAAA